MLQTMPEFHNFAALAGGSGKLGGRGVSLASSRDIISRGWT